MKALQVFLSRQFLVGVIFLFLSSCYHRDETNTTENAVTEQADNTVVQTENNAEPIEKPADALTVKEAELPVG
ncbi:MAG: hypothetical protein ABI729_10875, partial [Chitinophagales bacterium]